MLVMFMALLNNSAFNNFIVLLVSGSTPSIGVSGVKLMAVLERDIFEGKRQWASEARACCS